MAKSSNKTRRILIGFAGWSVLLAGIIMIPYPGPGWAVVFIGLTILAKEFQWAHEVNEWLRAKYDNWERWMADQPGYVKALFWLLTALTVVVTIWVLNGYGMIDAWFNLDQPWLHSPLPFFK